MLFLLSECTATENIQFKWIQKAKKIAKKRPSKHSKLNEEKKNNAKKNKIQIMTGEEEKDIKID